MLLILVSAAALAPWLFWGSKWLLTHVDTLVWPWSEVARADFSRIFNRAVLLSALVVLPLYAKRLGLSCSLLPSLSLQYWGRWQLLLGFGLAAGLLLLLGFGYVQLGYYTLREPTPWASVMEPLVSAVSVSVVEELLFRGLIFGLLLRSMSTRWACVACTALFAVVHFLKPPEDFALADTAVHAGSGFSLVGVILSGFFSAHFFLAEFLTLCAVGWALVHARVSTGALWLSMGLHAGWVFGLKWFSALTLTTKWLRRGRYLPWVGDNLKVGLCSLFVIVVTGILAVALSRRFTRKDS